MNTTAALLATAGTIEGIQQLINKFWFSTKYTVNPNTLAIEHPEKTTEGYAVRLKAGRYRFESVTHAPLATPLTDNTPDDFHLQRTTPRKPAPTIQLTNDRTKQATLFDAGGNDLPGQQHLFDDIQQDAPQCTT